MMAVVPLYHSTAVRQGLGRSLRPGGEWLTRHILELTRPGDRQRVLDAGCGPGSSLELLRESGLQNILGVDLDWGFLTEAQGCHCPVLQADLSQLPLADQKIDVILCECVWNLTAKDVVLAEFSRVIRPGGLLAISDIYCRTPPSRQHEWPVSCCFAAAGDLATVQSQVARAGFTVTVIEDHSRLLRETAARFVFEHGSLHGFWLAVTGSADLADQACQASASVNPGLFLLLATRNNS